MNYQTKNRVIYVCEDGYKSICDIIKHFEKKYSITITHPQSMHILLNRNSKFIVNELPNLYKKYKNLIFNQTKKRVVIFNDDLKNIKKISAKFDISNTYIVNIMLIHNDFLYFETREPF